MKKLIFLLILAVVCPHAMRAQIGTNEVTFGGQTPTLMWDKSPDTTVVGYMVRYGVIDGTMTNEFEVGDINTVRISTLTPFMTNFIFVTAFNTNRVESDPSNVVFYYPGATNLTYVDPVTTGGGETNTPSGPGTTNNPPVTIGLTNLTNSDAQFIGLNLAPAFSDVDSPNLIYWITNLPPGLTLDTNSGLISGQITRNASTNSPYLVTVKAIDSSSASVQTSFTWTITNLPPVAVNDRFAIAENTTLSGSVAANDYDPDGDPLSFGVVAPPAHGILGLNANGSFTYLPAANYNGTDQFTYRVTDDNNGINTAKVDITVTPVNGIPVITSNGGSSDVMVTVPENQTSVTTITASDPDKDSLTYTIIGGGDFDKFALDPTTGVLTFKTPPDYENPTDQDLNNSYLVVVQVSDGQGGTATQNLTALVTDVNETIPNRPPTTMGLTSRFSSDSETVSVTLANAFLDPDGDALKYQATGLPPGLTINTNSGLISGTIYRAASQASPFSVVVRAVDPSGAYVETSFTWTVANPPPVAVNDRFATAENTTLSGSVSANDYDPDADPLVFNVVTPPAHGTLGLNANGSFTYLPASNYNGNDQFTYQVRDDNGGANTARVDITVNPVNQKPVITSNGGNPNVIVSVPENQTGVTTITALDPEQDTLTYAIIGGDDFDKFTLDPTTGVLTFKTPPDYEIPTDRDANNSYLTVIQVSDGQGGNAVQNITVLVTNVNEATPNRPPTTIGLPNRLSSDSETVSVTVTNGFLDPDGDALRYQATGLPPGLTINANPGLIGGIINRAASQTSPFNVVVRAVDPSGAYVETSFAWTVTNPPPVAVNDLFSTAENTTFSGSVSANDYDPDGDPLALSVVASPAHGTLALLANGLFTYLPASNYNGADQFTYQALDGNGGGSTARVDITVTTGTGTGTGTGDGTGTVDPNSELDFWHSLRLLGSNVTSLTVTGSMSPTITWNQITNTDYTGYYLRYGLPGVLTNRLTLYRIDQVKLTNLMPDKVYFIYANGYTAAKTESAPCNALYFVPRFPEPTDLHVNGLPVTTALVTGPRSLVLAWNASPESSLNGYYLNYSFVGGAPRRFEIGITTNMTLSGLSLDRQYNFFITAHHASGAVSRPSNTQKYMPREHVLNYTVALNSISRVIEPVRQSAATLMFPVTGGRDYSIQASDDLVNWVTIELFVAAADGAHEFVDPEGATHSRRFYRVIEENDGKFSRQ